MSIKGCRSGLILRASLSLCIFLSPILCLIHLSLVCFVSPNHMKLSASLSRLNGIPVPLHIKGLWLWFHLGEGKWVNSKVMHSKARLHCAFAILFSKKSSVRRRCMEQLRTPLIKSGLSSPSFLHFWKCVGVSFLMPSVTQSSTSKSRVSLCLLRCDLLM